MFKIIHGTVSPAKPTLYCVVYNEMYYLPAFLDHYRGLGVEQFIFIDDHSTDESREFLTREPDTVIVHPSMRYGDLLDGKRAGPQWKTYFAQEFLRGRWALCVDADEFLVMHSQSLADVIRMADARGDRALAAVMVDMYPSKLEDMEDPGIPVDFASLLNGYPFFDRGPYLNWRRGKLRPEVLYEGATGRLLERSGNWPARGTSLFSRLMQSLRPRKKRSVYKVPLVKWEAGLAYMNAHTLNHAPSAADGLALLHLKYTGALARKIEWAVERKSFNKGSRGYSAIASMLEMSKDQAAEFRFEGTCRYGGYEDLVKAGIVPFSRG